GQAEDGAGAGAGGEAQLAAMGARQLAGDRQTETAAAGAGRAEERAKQIFSRLWRQPGAVIGDLDRDGAALARRGKAQPVGASFDRVAREVEENSVQLIAVG